MKQTYDDAMGHILESEGGYTNDPQDSGGATNWGITIWDARMYWKPHATAADVRAMPLSVAMEIYRKHYADPMHYDELPAGVDYAVLDYGINSGISRSAKVLQRLVGADVDGKMGPQTVAATLKADSVRLINQICDERLHFLQGLHIWSTFGRGWSRRVREVRMYAKQMAQHAAEQVA